MAQKYRKSLHFNKQEYQPVGSLLLSDPGSHTLRRDQDGGYEMEIYRGRAQTAVHNVPSTTEHHATSNASAWTTDKQDTKAATNALHSKRHDFSAKDWQWECGSSIFSLGCSAAVIGILVAYDTKPLNDWTYIYGITLNTVVAVLSTLSRTSLMVPVASSISQLKWMHLVSAPRSLRDFQAFEDASRGPWGSLELIWRLHLSAKLAAWGSIITILSLAMGPFSQQLLSYPSSSVTSGTAVFKSSHIYDTQIVTPRSYREPSISALMGPKMQGAILNGLFNPSSPVQYGCPTGNCVWGDFSTLAVTSSCQNMTSVTDVTCRTIPGAMSCNYTSSAAATPQLVDYTSDKGRERPFTAMIAQFATANLQEPFGLPNPDVMKCEMRLCARVVRNMTVINGTLDPGNFEDIELEGTPQRVTRDSIYKPWMAFNIVGEHRSYSGNRTFLVHWMDFVDIQNFLHTVFTAAAKRTELYHMPLLNATDRIGTVAAISQSMTFAFLDAPSSEEVKGKAMRDELFIKVHWPWIILPLLEVVMGVAFLLCTLIHTYRKGVTVWKSSGIVALLTVLVGWDTQELTAPNWRELQERSKNMRGQMVPNDADIQGFHRS